MTHFTPIYSSPREESLNFIRAFARLYVPSEDNEAEARRLAHNIAYEPMADC